MQGLSPNLPRGRDIPLPCSGQRVTHLATVAAPSAETSRTAFNPKSGSEAGLNALAPRAPGAPARLRPRSGLAPALHFSDDPPSRRLTRQSQTVIKYFALFTSVLTFQQDLHEL